MTWQRYITLDPYLCGSLAAAEQQEQTAEQTADSIGLTGDRRADFLHGWKDEIASQAQERKEQLVKEYDEMAQGYECGDPAGEEEERDESVM